MSRTVRDDLGVELDLPDDVRRVVCLVPSLTEAIATSVPGLLVGATQWCTHPADLDVTRVRGTKNPDRRAIAALAPDLVVANREENRRLDVDRMRAAGIAVWVTVIESVEEALASMRRLFVEALATEVPSWLVEATGRWADPPRWDRRVAVPVWRDPWLVVGSRTFTDDLCARLGLRNVFHDSPDRYPATTPEEILASTPDLVLLPDEPYQFSATDGPEVFTGTSCALVEGRSLTWYGPSLLTAANVLRRQIETARPA